MATQIGVVKALIGEVTAMAADGSIRTLQIGDMVFANELISTGEGGAVEIEFADGSVMDLGRNSQALLDSEVFDPSATAVAEAGSDDVPDDIAALQQALLEGEDPTQVGEATAAGAGVEGGNEGHEPVFVDYLNPAVTPDAGFDTIGVSNSYDLPEEDIIILEEEEEIPPAVPVVSVSVDVEIEIDEQEPPETDPPTDGVPTPDYPVLVEGNAASVLEGTSEGTKQVVFVINLSESFSQDVQVTYELRPVSTNGAADNPEDWFDGPSPQTVTIPAGSTSFPVYVEIVEDNIPEANGVFEIVLISANNATINPDADSAMVTIYDDDVTVEATDAIVDEDDIPVIGNDDSQLGDDDATPKGTITYNLGGSSLEVLSLSTGPISFTTVDDETIETSWDSSTNTLTGYVSGDSDDVVFTVELTNITDTSADYTVTLEQPIKHPLTDDPSSDDEESALEDNLSFDIDVYVADVTGSNTTSFTIDIDDDIPDAEVRTPGQEELVTALTLDESPLDGDGVDEAMGDFSAYFVTDGNEGVQYGADGEGDVEYSLKLSGEGLSTGLYALDNTDQATDDLDGYGQGDEILLYTNGDVIEGRVGNDVYFTISVDADAGTVTFTRGSFNIWHSNDLDSDDAETMALSGDDTLKLLQTVTDADGDEDEAAINLAGSDELDGPAVTSFTIEDDGPGDAADASYPANGNVFSLPGTESYGTDGAGEVVWTGESGGEITNGDGTLTVDAAGNFSFNWDGPLTPTADTPFINYSATFTYGIKDADGDISYGTLDYSYSDSYEDLPLSVEIGVVTDNVIAMDETQGAEDRYNDALDPAEDADDSIVDDPSVDDAVDLIGSSSISASDFFYVADASGGDGGLTSGVTVNSFLVLGSAFSGQGSALATTDATGGFYETNLSVSSTGDTIYLYQTDATTITGYTGETTDSEVALVITLESGTLTVEQHMAIEHGDTDYHDDAAYLQLLDGAQLLLGATANASDLDVDGIDNDDATPDYATYNIANGTTVLIEDDGPTAELVAGDGFGEPLIVVEGNESEPQEVDVDGVPSEGTDGLLSEVYSLELTLPEGEDGIDSGLDTLALEDIILYQTGDATISGRLTPDGEDVFTISIDQNNGTITVVSGALYHDLLINSGEYLTLDDAIEINAVYTVTDNDGDTAVDILPLSGEIRFYDTEPVDYTPEDAVIANVAGTVINGNLEVDGTQSEDGIAEMRIDTITLGSGEDALVISENGLTTLKSGGEFISVSGLGTGSVIGTIPDQNEDGEPEIIFTMELDQSGESYTFTLVQPLDDGAGTIPFPLAGVNSGNPPFIRSDTPEEAFDLLFSSSVNGVPGTVNTSQGSPLSNGSVGVGGGQTFNDGDVLAIDFVTDLVINKSGNVDTYDYGTHYGLGKFSFTVAGSGSVTVRAYKSTNTDIAGTEQEHYDELWDGSGLSKQTINSITINGLAVDPSRLISDGSGGFTITGVETLDVITVGVSSVDGLYDRLEIENSSTAPGSLTGDSYDIGNFGYALEATGDTVELSFGTTQVDGDGDTSTGDVGITIEPQAIASTIDGSEFDDTLLGGAGNDIIDGAAGNDIISGGLDNDILTGGLGADTFVWNAGDTGVDTVTDFNQTGGAYDDAEGDVLNLADVIGDIGGGDIADYISVTDSVDGAVIEISDTGDLAGNVTQTIVLEGVTVADLGPDLATILSNHTDVNPS